MHKTYCLLEYIGPGLRNSINSIFYPPCPPSKSHMHQIRALSLSRVHLGSVIAPNLNDIPLCMETVIGLAVVVRRQT